MRIAFVTETFPPEINGVSLCTAHAVHHLRRAGHEVHLVRPRQRHELDKPSLTGQEWRTSGVGLPLWPDLRVGWASVAALRRHWQRQAPAVVHAATPGPLAWAALRAARAQGIATTADFRGTVGGGRHPRLGWLQPVLLGYLRRLHAMADCSFVPTTEVAGELAMRGFERLAVVGRGVDSNLYSPARRDEGLRESWGVGPGDRVLLHVGRLVPEGNVALALAAYECMRLDNPRLRMVVVGDGPQRARFAAAHPRVRFLGVQRGLALATIYASADVFVQPHTSDHDGTTLLEAMASGLGVTAFNTVAAGALVEHGRTGWLAACGHEAGFFAAVRRALLDGDPTSALRMRARAAALRADWKTQLQAFERGLCTVADAAVQRVHHSAVPA